LVLLYRSDITIGSSATDIQREIEHLSIKVAEVLTLQLIRDVSFLLGVVVFRS
jgi:hypothetical protein